jgi:hypothetical protein
LIILESSFVVGMLSVLLITLNVLRVLLGEKTILDLLRTAGLMFSVIFELDIEEKLLSKLLLVSLVTVPLDILEITDLFLLILLETSILSNEF